MGQALDLCIDARSICSSTYFLLDRFYHPLL